MLLRTVRAKFNAIRTTVSRTSRLQIRYAYSFRVRLFRAIPFSRFAEPIINAESNETCRLSRPVATVRFKRVYLRYFVYESKYGIVIRD